MREYLMPPSVAISGFDSAWSRKNRGAIAHLLVCGESIQFEEPRAASFDEALTSIECFGTRADAHVIGIDQPLIVRNEFGYRPVERVFQSLVGSVGGAIQPGNRTKADLFGDDAPIWPFLERLHAVIDWERSIDAHTGRSAIEIYPAAALLGLFPVFLKRNRAPKYNPSRPTFTLMDWQLLCDSLGASGADLGIAGLPEWASAHRQLSRPRKVDQDCLDAAICVVVTYLWWRFGYQRSLVVGDLATGYIVTPTSPEMTTRLNIRAETKSVPIRFGDEVGSTAC